MVENVQIAPNLFIVVDILEKKRVSIATDWVNVPTVKSIFSKRKISIKKFRDSYAVPIIEYFIAVVRGEKLLGDCPIMGKFVRFMVTKGISPKEIFDICMGFRRVLISFLFKDTNVLKNPDIFMDEVATVFDANLSGVLDIFTDLYAASQKKIEIAKLQKEKLSQTLKIINSINTKIVIIQNGRIILGNKPFFEMTGVKDLKELYSKYQSGFEYISDINIYNDKFKQDISLWLSKVYANNKPFQCQIYNEKVKQKLNYSGRVTNMLVDDIEQYILTLSNISEHIQDEKSIQDLLTHDELTGFRNYPTFEKLLSKMVDDARENNFRLFISVVDIPKLRYINDTKGTSAGDMVISGVAEDLRFVVNNNVYYGRLNGSRFGIVMQYEQEQLAYDWCVDLFKILNEKEDQKSVAITELYVNQNINETLLRVYDLVEEANNSDEICVAHDFTDVMEYKVLTEQKEFTDRIKKNSSLQLSLFYRELPVTSDVKVVSASNDNVILTLSQKQMKVAKVGMKTYFNLDKIGSIKATIKDINENIAMVDSFLRDKHSPLNRAIYRVEASADIKAYISENNRDFTVKILDLNNEYVAIRIDRKRNFDINSLVYLDMQLPISDIAQSCISNATITRIEKIPGAYKMVLLCHFDTATQELVSKYIAKQQLEIIHEMQGQG